MGERGHGGAVSSRRMVRADGLQRRHLGKVWRKVREEEHGRPSTLASSVRPTAGAARGGGAEALVALQARGDGA